MNSFHAYALALACALLLFTGCGSSDPSPVEHNTNVLNQLPEEDRQLAIDQWNCIVCKQLLAKDGPPQKSLKSGTPVFCCDHDCLEKFEKNPRAYRASLSQ